MSNGTSSLPRWQFNFSTLGLFALLAGIALSGLINNCFSGLAVIVAIVCWFATAQVRGSAWAVGIFAVCGWLFLAAFIGMLIRQH